MFYLSGLTVVLGYITLHLWNWGVGAGGGVGGVGQGALLETQFSNLC